MKKIMTLTILLLAISSCAQAQPKDDITPEPETPVKQELSSEEIDIIEDLLLGE